MPEIILKIVDNFDLQESELNSSVSQWSGMVGQLTNDEADICLSGISMVLDRAEVMDFTLTIVSALNTMTGLKPGKNIRGDYKAFLEVFDETAWMGLAAVAIIVGTTTSTILLTKHNVGCWKNFQLGMVKFGLACLQLGDVTSGKLQAWRVLQVTIAICGYLCFTAYTSDLTAILTVRQSSQLPKSFGEIISNDYRIMVGKGAWPAIRMESSLPGSDMNKAFNNHTILFNYDGDMETIFQKMTADPKLLYFGDSLHFNKHAKFKIIKDFEEVRISKLAFGLQHDSEFRSIFNHYISKMFQGGIISKLSKRWLQDDNPGDWSERIFVDEAAAIGFGNVLFPLLLLVGGSVIAIFLACFEKSELLASYVK